MDNGGSAALLQTIYNELINLHRRLSRLDTVHVMATPQRFVDAERIREISRIERSIKLVHGRKFTHEGGGIELNDGSGSLKWSRQLS